MKFASYWQAFTKAVAAVAALIAFGAVSHGACTAYASTPRVVALEARVQLTETTEAQLAEHMKSVESKLDLAIDLLRGGTCK